MRMKINLCMKIELNLRRRQEEVGRGRDSLCFVFENPKLKYLQDVG